MEKGSSSPKQTGIVIKNITEIDNRISLGSSITVDKKDHDIQRELDKANGDVGVDLEFGNNVITSNVQNTYNDDDENYYVASSSMPSYLIEKTVEKASLSDPKIDIAGIGTQQLLERNNVTGLYSKLQFPNVLEFITGDALAYIPENDPLVGLDTTGGAVSYTHLTLPTSDLV
mgnify:FL=1